MTAVVPEDTPVTTPEVPIVATAGVALVQVPPAVVFESVVLSPTQTTAVPVIAGAHNIVVKLTVAVFVAAYPFTVKLIIAVATLAELVRTAVYVPSLLSVTELIVPAVVDIPTMPPDVVRFAPAAVFNCTVIVDVVTPLPMMLVGLAAIVEVAVLGTTGTEPQIDTTGVVLQLKDEYVVLSVFPALPEIA